MANIYFSITIPQELAQKAKRLAELRGKNAKGARWSKNLVIHLALKEYLEKYDQELEGIEGGVPDQVMGEYSSPMQDHRLREVEKPPLQKITQRREKKGE
jgi:predicted transcriptional regulator